MAEKQSNKDRLKEITDSIENGIKELFESEKYKNYLRTMSLPCIPMAALTEKSCLKVCMPTTCAVQTMIRGCP